MVRTIKKERSERCSKCLYGDKCVSCGICTFFVPLYDDFCIFEDNKEAEYKEYLLDFYRYVSDFE